MRDNTVGAIAAVCITVLVILFYGEPDLMSTIMMKIKGG